MEKTISPFIAVIALITVACPSTPEGETYYSIGGVTSNFGPRAKLLTAPKLDSIPYLVVADGKAEGAADSVTVSVTMDFVRTAEKFDRGWDNMKMTTVGWEGDIAGYRQLEFHPDAETKTKLNALNDVKEGDTVKVTFTTRSTREVVDKFNHKKCHFNVQW